MKTIENYQTITTERLLLRNVLLTDAPQMYHWLSDETTVKWLSGQLSHSIKDVENLAIKGYFWQDVVGTKKYGIALRNTNELIGSVDFRQKEDNQTAEIGYVLTPAQRGQGFMHEAICELLTIGFDELGLNLIWLSHDIDNIQSRHVAERLGFKQRETTDNQGHLIWSMTHELYNNQK
ncbi:GNAT family N-acetyltransferase [Leuconostoc rapi]|uniref:GNAT family N-acetyltransferase n=1 Tax=Leuconostoc rapi TaxID=1406906 RepID=UPI00195910C7|nr:GNAT family N-acetyltransferase [Leuconostoc rapi]MBM7435849.1 ribosomal-protein-alanine N-acetyltransferase [Leuconostoc rapi]